MLKKKMSVAVVCAMAAFIAVALCGCGLIPGQSDADLIRADVEKQLSMTAGADAVAEMVESDPTLKAYIELGFDMDGAIANMSALTKIEVVNVGVEGDRGVASVDVTVPDCGDATADAIVQEVAKIDTANKTDDELTQAFIDTLNNVFKSPNFPTTTSHMSIDYIKKDGQWQIESPENVAQQLYQLMSGTS